MIIDKKTLHLYLDADKFALAKTKSYPGIKDSIWKYERTLRYYEYYRNTGNKIMRMIYGWMLYKLGERLGFSVPANVFGPGLRINHSGLLIVNSNAKVGKWCDIHQGVNIGENGYYEVDGTVVSEVPFIGDFVYIGPGAKVYGNTIVGNCVRIGANAVVHKNVKSNMSVFGNLQEEIPFKRKLLTIACKDTEDAFLKKFPQYKGLI